MGPGGTCPRGSCTAEPALSCVISVSRIMGEGQEMELERWVGPIRKGLHAVLSLECPGSGVDLL